MDNSTNSRQRNFVTGLIIIVGLIVIIFFGWRTVRAFRHFHGHRPPPPFGDRVEAGVELIQEWMTIPYISITYRLPPNLLYETLDIRAQGNEKKSLKQLNDEFFPGAPGIVLEKVKAAIQAHQPPPTAMPPATVVPAETVPPPLAP